MLQMRPCCEICDKDLPANRGGAVSCSFECTFCTECVGDICPNCGGQLTPRPMRVGAALETHPASTKRILKKT